MLQPAVDITTSVHKFETILYQFKRDNLNEVDQSHYQKIMGLSVRQMNALGALNRLMTNRPEDARPPSPHEHSLHVPAGGQHGEEGPV